MTRKCIKVDDFFNGQHSASKNISFKAPLLRSNLCDYNDTYIVVKGTIDLLADAANENDKAQKDVTFKTNASVRSCSPQINKELIGNIEDLDIVMPRYNLLEYSYNYSLTSGSLCNYYKDENDDVDDDAK